MYHYFVMIHCEVLCQKCRISWKIWCMMCIGTKYYPKHSPAAFIYMSIMEVDMSSIEDRYYKINRILLKIFGIWPYQNSKWMHIKALIITSIFLSGIFVQVYTIYSLSISLTFKESVMESLREILNRIIILVGSVYHTWMHVETNS